MQPSLETTRGSRISEAKVASGAKYGQKEIEIWKTEIFFKRFFEDLVELRQFSQSAEEGLIGTGGY